MSKLYIVPTPIGNLDDITLRAIKTLEAADFILAEDTRTTSVLLKHLGIEKRLYAHHKFNEHATAASLTETIGEGRTVALVSDAGTPGISDPGFLLVRECVKSDISVQCLPGATAFVPALVSSALPADKFVFEGFLPQKKGRQTRLNFLKNEERTIIFYESPYRVLKTLTQLSEVFGPGRSAAAVREISKLHEECVRGTLAELVEHFTKCEPRGEFVLLVGGATEDDAVEDNE